MRKVLRHALPVAVALFVAGWATPAGANHEPKDSANMDLLFHEANSTGAINSDLAFWGDLAYAGNYNGFKIFDISDPSSPSLVEDFACFGPQNDPVVWSSGERTILALAVDRTLAGPACGSPPVAHGDPNGWEGVRIFDVTDPTDPQFVKSVYLDCGAHTITAYPREQDKILLYASSYPLRPGPTCGAVNGPAAGRDPLHGVIQVVKVPVNNPAAAKEIAEPQITYPGDPDNKIVWSEHGLPGPPALEYAARACHDIGVFVELKLAAAACAEQGQLWHIKDNGIPDTEHPIWVQDDEVDETGITGDPNDPGVVVDFYHSATFSWDGSVVNFIDESFGEGCPPVTPAPSHHPGDTGRMFFIDTGTGDVLSTFMNPRTTTASCYNSAHMGSPVVAGGKDLLVNAWYMGGVNVIDFSDPENPAEIAHYDVTGATEDTGSDNWSAYWYQGSGDVGTGAFPVYASDGVHNPAPVAANGRGFDVFSAMVGDADFTLGHLNPQTQEEVH